MYESRRKRGARGANGPRITRPGSTVDRLGSSGDLEKSRRSPDSVSESILGAGAKLSGGASEMYESRRKRGASGANGPRIRRPGSTVNRLGSSGNLEKSRRSPDSESESIRGARERLCGARRKCTKVGENEARAGRMSPESGDPDRRPVGWELQEIARNPGDRRIRCPKEFAVQERERD